MTMRVVSGASLRGRLRAAATASGPAPLTPPLDGISVMPGVALSLSRRLATSYTGVGNDKKLFTVRRSAGGTQAIPYLDATNEVDIASHDAYVGAGDGFVANWWNQGALGASLSYQTGTATAQPATRAAGVNFTRNGKLVCENTQGVAVNLASSAAVQQNTDTHMAFVGVMFRATSSFNRQYYRSTSSGLQAFVQYSGGSGNRAGTQIDTGDTALLDPSPTSSDPKVLAFYQTGTNAKAWVNANNFRTTSSATSLVLSTSNYNIGDDSATGVEWLEIYHWSGTSLPSDAEFTALISNLMAYYGIP